MDAAVRETDQLKRIDEAVFGTASELPGRNEPHRRLGGTDPAVGQREGDTEGDAVSAPAPDKEMEKDALSPPRLRHRDVGFTG